jgi:NADH-quinone oxidoreductase subunit I
MLRCIFCGFCEDSCPTEAIVLGDQYEMSFGDRHSSIYTKELLLEPVSGDAETTPQKTKSGEFTRSVPVLQSPQD